MKSEKINESLNFIDNDLVCDYVAKRDQLLKKRVRRRAFIGSGGLVACACLILCFTLIIQPLIFEKDPPEILNSIVRGDKVTGERYISFKNEDDSSRGDNSTADQVSFHFQLSVIVHATVEYVLPDLYFSANCYYRIAVLNVIESIRGENIPNKILFCYAYYGEDIFDGYGSFIFSIKQIGVENYVMLNHTQGAYDYFPHMFAPSSVNDIGYGPAIAFKWGRVDKNFYKKANYRFKSDELINKRLEVPFDYYINPYPASTNDTVKEVVRKIRELEKYSIGNISHKDCDYITLSDFLLSQEAKEVIEYTKPNGSDVFSQRIARHEKSGKYIDYERLINGLPTDESLTVFINGDGTVEVNVSGKKYTDQNVLDAPPIGEHMKDMTYDKLPHPDLSDIYDHDKLKFESYSASGSYKLVNGKTYGIIRTSWYYRYPTVGTYTNYVHFVSVYVIDTEGNISVMTDKEYQEFLKGTT